MRNSCLKNPNKSTDSQQMHKTSVSSKLSFPYIGIKLIYKLLRVTYYYIGGKSLAETRNFALRDKKGNEIGVFSGKQPRQAALKAANRGHTDIELRERGTKKVHMFKGERVQVKKPKGAPAWMPDKIWKPKVKKVGVKTLEEI
jgi:hypothetical protein